MACKRYIRAVVVAKHVIEQSLEARLLGCVGFAQVGLPEGVGFGESGLKGVGGVGGVDVGFGGAPIAGVDADGFAEELGEEGKMLVSGVLNHEGSGGLAHRYLFYLRDQRFSAWKLEAREGDVGSSQAATERAGIVGLRDRDFLLGDFFGPEGIGD